VEQLALVTEIQSGALAFVNQACEIGPRYNLKPFADLNVSARWTTAILGRLLLLPDDDELTMLGTLKHDVNLGTAALAPMLDGNAIKNLDLAHGLPAACTAPAPPMWLAGSFASLSPAHGYLYMLFGANHLSADVFGDIKCGSVQIGLFGKNGSATMETASIYRNGMGDMRIRIPISKAMNLRIIAVALAKISSEGVLHGVTTQSGKTIQKASRSNEVKEVPNSKLTTAGLHRSGAYYRATDEDGCLLIDVEPLIAPVTIFSIGLTVPGAGRVLAAQDADAINEELATTLLGQAPRRATNP
jgi:hypothetical protein